MVDVAPYGGVFPLTAIINKANHNVQNVKVTVLGKGEKGIPISYDVGPQAINTHDGIPVFGLYPDYVNKVKVDWTEEGKNKLIRGPFTPHRYHYPLLPGKLPFFLR
ncbi:arylsulfotransferase [Salmonella enterica subsp. enterica serovar Heidelberg str. N4496]|nr:arylsulfotransferase [Salmonella enterica subsp. enterica serovar Heidelberg str. N4496]KDU73746.1 arylsulfotransferase [Salmonella enterica subsp. enterica serovar Heidelberg str. 640151-11]KJU36785.1 arylsulfotransferase [Salmonella enterica subsp. enterica serovar Heidelberg str. 88-0312]